MASPDPRRAGLTARRAELVERIATLTADIASIVAATEGSNVDDEHDPEGATIAFERQQLAALLDEAQRRLADLDRALRRLDAGTYGGCESCGAPIDGERLAARPDARVCISCAGRDRRA